MIVTNAVGHLPGGLHKNTAPDLPSAAWHPMAIRSISQSLCHSKEALDMTGGMRMILLDDTRQPVILMTDLDPRMNDHLGRSLPYGTTPEFMTGEKYCLLRI